MYRERERSQVVLDGDMQMLIAFSVWGLQNKPKNFTGRMVSFKRR